MFVSLQEPVPMIERQLVSPPGAAVPELATPTRLLQAQARGLGERRGGRGSPAHGPSTHVAASEVDIPSAFRGGSSTNAWVWNEQAEQGGELLPQLRRPLASARSLVSNTTFAVVTSPNGFATVATAVPNDPQLNGQFVVLDPAGAFLDFLAFTNGITGIVGP